jgi:hypothetical protein
MPEDKKEELTGDKENRTETSQDNVANKVTRTTLWMIKLPRTTMPLRKCGGNNNCHVQLVVDNEKDNKYAGTGDEDNSEGNN